MQKMYQNKSLYDAIPLQIDDVPKRAKIFSKGHLLQIQIKQETNKQVPPIQQFQ